MITKKYLDELTFEIIGASIEVHKIMGRGLLESVYHQCLMEELKHRKINFSSELKINKLSILKHTKEDNCQHDCIIKSPSHRRRQSPEHYGKIILIMEEMYCFEEDNRTHHQHHKARRKPEILIHRLMCQGAMNNIRNPGNTMCCNIDSITHRIRPKEYPGKSHKPEGRQHRQERYSV